MKFDEILEEHLGAFGIYQKRIYLLMCTPAIFCGLQLLSPVFTLNIPKHRCALPGVSNDTYAVQGLDHEILLNATIPWKTEKGASVRDSCLIYKDDVPAGQNRTTQECSAWVYDNSVFKNTVVTEFNMVCGTRGLRSLANSILFAGLLVGSLVFGIISDVFGRKMSVMMAVLLHLGTGIGTAFAPNYTAFVIIRFFNGASSITLFISPFVYVMELVGPSKRTYAGVIIEFFWCFGLLLVGCLAYFIRDWHHLQLTITIPVVVLFGLYWIVPESPRWLLSRGREKEAESILRVAADVNDVTLPQKLFDKDTLDDGPQAKITEMFTSPVLLVRTLIIFFNWLVVTMVFYGLALNVGNLVGDIFLNFTIGNIMEVASNVLVLILLDRLGRKLLHCGSMLLGGIACLCTIFPVLYGNQEHEWITMTLSMIGRFGASGAFAIIYVFSAELFPTVVRNSGMGGSSVSGRIGGIISPYIADLVVLVDGDISSALPLIVFGVLTLMAGILALGLPETLHRKLPETIEDAKSFGKTTGKRGYHLDHAHDTNIPHVNPAFDGY
ncbi:organic cation transporter protein-like [Haliotis rufescens]|uniref:organic cation transporter protein-like n=1 Tax=Haliotis rufescens TaxID=6454 RepID=UPI00201EC6F9|nr:organic cation transporter protein-like [Haliotis rufescens]